MTTALAMDGRMLVLDLEAALNRLPAALRAKFRWSAPQLRGALRRLVEEPLSDALLDETAESLFEPMMSLGATFLDLVNTDRTLLAALGADVERDLERLRAYLHDDEAEDTLAWIVAFWKSCLDGVSRESAHTHAFGPSDFAALRADPAMRLLLRCEVASFGVLECVKRELPTERAVELLDAAFLDMMSLRELLYPLHEPRLVSRHGRAQDGVHDGTRTVVRLGRGVVAERPDREGLRCRARAQRFDPALQRAPLAT